MRIGLIAALRRSEEGALRAELPLAGRPVLAWQAALLQSLGVERVLCLTETGAASGAMLALQRTLERTGTAFHALKGFAALPALVRAEDDLIVIADGLVPEPVVVQALLSGGGGLARAVASLPADHPLAAGHPEDFERIDATRCWAGVLAMRGAPVQQLADMPADADAISLLLRLALQAGASIRDLSPREVVPESWLLADNAQSVAQAGAGLIARAALPVDGRAPGSSLAGMLARAIVARGSTRAVPVAAGAALAAMLGGLLFAASGVGGAGLLLAGVGAFAAEVAWRIASLSRRLIGKGESAGSRARVGLAVDLAAALTGWFALAPWPDWQPLAALGPVVVGLARLVADGSASALSVAASDRTSLLLLLSLAAVTGFLPEMLACLSLGLLAALLLRRAED